MEYEIGKTEAQCKMMHELKINEEKMLTEKKKGELNQFKDQIKELKMQLLDFSFNMVMVIL